MPDALQKYLLTDLMNDDHFRDLTWHILKTMTYYFENTSKTESKYTSLGFPPGISPLS